MAKPRDFVTNSRLSVNERLLYSIWHIIRDSSGHHRPVLGTSLGATKLENGETKAGEELSYYKACQLADQLNIIEGIMES